MPIPTVSRSDPDTYKEYRHAPNSLFWCCNVLSYVHQQQYTRLRGINRSHTHPFAFLSCVSLYRGCASYRWGCRSPRHGFQYLIRRHPVPRRRSGLQGGREGLWSDGATTVCEGCKTGSAGWGITGAPRGFYTTRQPVRLLYCVGNGGMGNLVPLFARFSDRWLRLSGCLIGVL